MQIEKKVFSKLFNSKTNLSKKVNLKMLDSLVSAMQKADDKRIEFYNVEYEWVNKYLDLQNDFPKLEALSQEYKETIIELRNILEEFKTSASSLGLDPRTIPQFEDALLTEGIFNSNADDSIDVINAGVNMTNNKL